MTWVSMGSTRSRANGGPYSQSVSNMEDNGIVDIDVNITVPEEAEPGDYTFSVKTRSYWDQDTMDESILTLTVEQIDPEPASEEDDAPFLGLSAIVIVILIGAILRKRI